MEKRKSFIFARDRLEFLLFSETHVFWANKGIYERFATQPVAGLQVILTIAVHSLRLCWAG